jgi:hypothetical protein
MSTSKADYGEYLNYRCLFKMVTYYFPMIKSPYTGGNSLGRISFNRLGLFAFCLLETLLLSECAAPFSTFKDEGSNADITRMNGNRLAGGMSFVELNVQRFQKEGMISYSLIVRYAGPTFVNIEPGKSLALIIDGLGKEIDGNGSKGHRNIVSLGLVEEIAYYHNVEPDLVRQIAYAKQVDVEIHGSARLLKRYFNKKNFSKFKAFCELYLNDKTLDAP